MMKNFAASLLISSCLLALGGCSKSKPVDQTGSAATSPENATPSDLPAQVDLADGTHYTGTLVSKNGSQMTFRGDNGATRTFDSRDIKSIRFGDTSNTTSAPQSNLTPSTTASAPPPVEQSQPTRRRHRGSDSSSDTASDMSRNTAPVPQDIVIPAGTQLQVRTNQAIDSKVATAGTTFSAEIANDVTDDSGRVAIPRGSPAALVIKQAGAGKIHANNLVLDMQSISVQGKEYEVDTADVSEAGKQGVGMNKRSGKYMGGGAALGAIIGAIAGGGKGAAIGAASGAGAGAATQIMTRGSVKVPAESLLTFKLQAPLHLSAR
jgi:hypothetical protein